MPSLQQIKWFLLFFAVFFAISSAAQYKFVEGELKNTVLHQLNKWADQFNKDISFNNGVDIKQYNKASPEANNYYVVLQDGEFLDLKTQIDLGIDFIPLVSSPVVASEEVFSKPTLISYNSKFAGKELWHIYAKKVKGGIVVLGITDLDDVKSPELLLLKNMDYFGSTLDEARKVPYGKPENSIHWIVISDDGRLMSGYGRVPLRTDDAMQLGKHVRLEDVSVNEKSYFIQYAPLRDVVNKEVGRIILPYDVSDVKETLVTQRKYNVGVAFLSFLLFLILAIIYSSKHEKEKSRIKESFSNYFSPNILEAILNKPETLKEGGERREVVILFSDIRSFTSLCEKLPPQQLTQMLQEYFTEMTEEVHATDGMVDKYIGDAVMAAWGVPLDQSDKADRAVKTAINMIKRLEKLQDKWKSIGYPIFNIGIGINLGTVTVGNFGSAKRYDYTMVGDAVNAASRIESLTKEYQCQIIISESTKEQMMLPVTTKYLDEALVKGKEKPIRIYEVIVS